MEFTDEIGCELVQACASDLTVVNAARVSFNKESQEMSPRDAGLIGFLMRNRHGTPFEHSMFTFKVEAPIVVVREHMRHRAGHSYNEYSGRYSKMEPKFYLPTFIRTQQGKPGAYDFAPILDSRAVEFRCELRDQCMESYRMYERQVDQGIAKEQARLLLHVNTFTKYFWTCNARSLMHFLTLRNHEAAMYEIAQVAKQAEEHFAELMPVTWKAYVDSGRKNP